MAVGCRSFHSISIHECTICAHWEGGIRSAKLFAVSASMHPLEGPRRRSVTGGEVPHRRYREGGLRHRQGQPRTPARGRCGGVRRLGGAAGFYRDPAVPPRCLPLPPLGWRWICGGVPIAREPFLATGIRTMVPWGMKIHDGAVWASNCDHETLPDAKDGMQGTTAVAVRGHRARRRRLRARACRPGSTRRGSPSPCR